MTKINVYAGTKKVSVIQRQLIHTPTHKEARYKGKTYVAEPAFRGNRETGEFNIQIESDWNNP